MKTAVITGSTRGLGYEMAKDLRRYGLNVILNGSNTERLEGAGNALKKLKGRGGEQKIELPGKTKRFYNIVAEPPDVVAHFLVKSMLANRKNNVRINRLTNVRLLSRFITAGYNTD